MKFKLRAFCKDTNSIQDIKDFKVKEKELTLTSDFKSNEYKLEDTDYLVIYRDTLIDILDAVYANGKKSNAFTPKKNKEVKEDIKVDTKEEL